MALNSAQLIGTGLLDGFRNRIINGDMRIDQRNAGASVTPGLGTYSVDRWRGFSSQASKFTLQQNAGSVTPPAGFTNYLGAVSSAATTPGTNDLYLIQQFIEGYNVSDLAWGTSSAQSIALSFWVRSSLTGTFGASIQNDLGDRSYSFTFSINSASTWEYKSIIIPGPTTGTWSTSTGKGLVLSFVLGTGSTTIPSANNTWLNANYYGAIGATNVVATNGATFSITGVQLEKGSVASDFERRSYGAELGLCQRYYEVMTTTDTQLMIDVTNATSYTQGYRYVVPKRATPTSIGLTNNMAGFGAPILTDSNSTGFKVTGLSSGTAASRVFSFGATISSEL